MKIVKAQVTLEVLLAIQDDAEPQKGLDSVIFDVMWKDAEGTLDDVDIVDLTQVATKVISTQPYTHQLKNEILSERANRST